MKKTESLRGNLAFNIIGAIVLVLMLFGVLVSFLGFANFTEAFKREYEGSTYRWSTSSTWTQAITAASSPFSIR